MFVCWCSIVCVVHLYTCMFVSYYACAYVFLKVSLSACWVFSMQQTELQVKQMNMENTLI